MKLSVVIPAYNEEGSLEQTIYSISKALIEAQIDHEILVINDNSTDSTESILQKISSTSDNISFLNNPGRNGFGEAVKFGLGNFTGDCVAIMMADMSDSPSDLIKFYRLMISKDLDCVFGSRFMKGSSLIDYPLLKRIVNRIANMIIRLSMGLKYNDTTNAFKLYKREVIAGIQPLLSPHFNLTIEMPLKAIIRGYTYGVLPNSWANRTSGESKLKLREMGSRYLFILLYCMIEKFFSRGDFKKKW